MSQTTGLHVDDYLLSPFSWDELHACTRTLVRTKKQPVKSRPIRGGRPGTRGENGERTTPVASDELVIDVACRTVLYQSRPLEMRSPVLFDLLTYFVCHPGVVMTRECLLEQVWRYENASKQVTNTRTVDVHVHWLRELLGDNSAHPSLIHTIRGVGYRFKTREQDVP